METERILALLGKKIGQVATVAELEELEVLLRAYPEYRYLEEVVQSMNGRKQHVEKNKNAREVMHSGWEQLAGKINQQEEPDKAVKMVSFNHHRRYGLFRIAAAAVLLFMLSVGAYILFNKHRQAADRDAMVTVKVEPQDKRVKKIILPDKTQIWLNAGSTISYAKTFNGNQRNVYLVGEAFFDVSHDPEHPFIVHAPHIKLRVLGTAFNVRAYNNEDSVEATLIRGKVQVQLTDEPEQKIMLAPREKLLVMNKLKLDSIAHRIPGKSELKYLVQMLPADSGTNIAETAWMQQDNKLIFSNELFGKVAAQLEAKYHKHITFLNPELRKERLSGVFDKENLREALNILKLTTGFKYSIEADTVYLRQ